VRDNRIKPFTGSSKFLWSKYKPILKKKKKKLLPLKEKKEKEKRKAYNKRRLPYQLLILT
jgi:hypothetical protein